MPVQTQEKTRQVTNPQQVQHVVNAVEAEIAQNHQGDNAEKEAHHQ